MNIRDLVDHKTFRLSQALDVGEHAGHFADWTANSYRQLARRSDFYGVVASATFSSQLQVVFETLEGNMLEQIGQLSPDKIMLCTLLAGTQMILNGQALEPGGSYLSSQVPLHAVIPQPVRVALIFIDRELFFERFRIRSAQVKQSVPFEVFLGQQNSCVDMLNRTVKSLLSALQANVHSADGLESLLRRLFADIQQVVQLGEVSTHACGRSNRAMVVSQGCELFNRHFADEAFGVLDLCESLQVSRRMLQYSFDSVLGVSPLNYMRAVRLNAAHQRLCVASPQPIQNVALDSGFNHLGRFSRYYREFYGELPSQTVARSQEGLRH
ncbi:helix-turn-helix domain-containing protein [Pseudomonas sp. dw_358]|uniref:helix-turn-helix domain-containing protein n=1 Tax=Pseudomonas sp. dw_358 TaxID=2720083 RepID=UPI001BD3202A|nr:helix-turn-helix domain-containing protein [Pseudomonas sp. dw_358]